eukprot:m51a1_g6019 hypothetical protein (197) ;mRNA; r:78680-79342
MSTEANSKADSSRAPTRAGETSKAPGKKKPRQRQAAKKRKKQGPCDKVARAPQEWIKQLEATSRFQQSAAIAFAPGISRYTCAISGSFECGSCHRQWASFRVSLDLWFSKAAGTFDVRIYRQQCIRCRKAWHLPAKDDAQWAEVLEVFTTVLTTRPGPRTVGREQQVKQTKPHEQSLCQLCRILGKACWMQGRENQ